MRMIGGDVSSVHLLGSKNNPTLEPATCNDLGIHSAMCEEHCRRELHLGVDMPLFLKILCILPC